MEELVNSIELEVWLVLTGNSEEEIRDRKLDEEEL